MSRPLLSLITFALCLQLLCSCLLCGRADEESLRARKLVEYNTFTPFLMEVTVDGNPWSSDATGQKASPRLWIYLASLDAPGR